METNADDLDAIEGAALAYFRAGMLDKSIAMYQRAIAADPTNNQFRVSLSSCYWYAGEYQNGIDVLSPALAQNQNTGIWEMAMENYKGLKQYEKAIEAGRMDVSKNPDAQINRLRLGFVLKLAGKPEEARKIWLDGLRRQEAKAATVENVRTHIWLSYYYVYLGEREKALRK